jgi:SIR2-like protein
VPEHKTVLILGAGFSCEAGLPSTKTVVKSFLKSPQSNLDPRVEEEITLQLKKFWKYAFNYIGRGALPALEDHFTVLDLAANSDRNIGPEYTPRKLRAIRRLSIHRVFQILDLNYEHSAVIDSLLSRLLRAPLSIVSTNWDIVVENHLKEMRVLYSYGLPVETLVGEEAGHEGIPLLMLHGSANWVYCDSCRRLYVGHSSDGKAALRALIYITRDDFRQLCPEKEEVINLVADMPRQLKTCKHCGNRLGARIATFSYRKEVSIPQFQTVWQTAFAALRDSSKWLFVGYSLPEADFEFRHLLKSAEKAVLGDNRQRTIQVILKRDRQAGIRFKRFFGITDEKIHQHGLSGCVQNCFSDSP